MILKYFHAIGRFWHAYSHKNLEPIDLYGSEHPLIMYLSEYDNASQDNIAAALMLDKGTVARSIARLEAKNLVQRSVNPENHRKNMVSLTVFGCSEVNKVKDISEHWKKEIMKNISQDDQKQFLQTLEQIFNNAKELLQQNQEK